MWGMTGSTFHRDGLEPAGDSKWEWGTVLSLKKVDLDRANSPR